MPNTAPTGERLAHMMRPVRSPALAIACVVAGLLLGRAGGRGDAPDDRRGTQARRGRRPRRHGVHRVVRAGEHYDVAELLPPAARRRRVRRATTIAAPGTTLSRPFVTVDGATVRVVSYRYGLTGVRFDQIWEFTSADGGATFDAGHPVGIAPFDEAVRGPGDTLTVTTNAESTGLAVQNVPLDGTDAGESQAILSADHPYNGTVGLAGPTMVAVFADASSNAQVRTSAGALNDAAAWTPPVDIGYADYPRLAGGPSGLFLLSGTPENALTVRKFNGTTFGPAVKIADAADDAQAHLTQDAAGRLHAVFAHNTAAGLELDYASSDNGSSWQSGPLLTQTNATQGIGALRAAIAPDHLGVAAWETSSDASSEIRVVGSGPRAASRRRCPASRWPSASSPARCSSPAGGKRTRLTGGATIPVGSQIDTARAASR